VSEIKVKKTRRKKAEIIAIKQAMVELIEQYRPLINRQLFYLMVVRGLIRKTQGDYKEIVCKYSVELRRSGTVGWDDITDETRSSRVVEVYSSMSANLWLAAYQYAHDIWEDMPVRVQFWVESTSAAGLIVDAANKWRVATFPSRGYSSHTFLHDAAIAMQEMTVRHKVCTHVYVFGDYDPSGKDIIRFTRDTLLEYGPRAAVEFHHVAVTTDQIEEWDLPTAPPKKDDSRTAKFGDTRTVELEAISPEKFRELVEGCVTQHFSERKLKIALKREEAVKQAAQEEIVRLWGDRTDKDWLTGTNGKM
jgi:hypothetical protein